MVSVITLTSVRSDCLVNVQSMMWTRTRGVLLSSSKHVECVSFLIKHLQSQFFVDTLNPALTTSTFPS